MGDSRERAGPEGGGRHEMGGGSCGGVAVRAELWRTRALRGSGMPRAFLFAVDCDHLNGRGARYSSATGRKRRALQNSDAS